MIFHIRHALTACSLAAIAWISLTADQDASRPKILGISLVRIRVSDFCKGKDFYSMVLGQHGHCPPGKTPEGGGIALHSSQSITLNVNSLIAGSPLNPPSLLEEIGFSTEDVQGLRRYLVSRNIPVEVVGQRSPSLLVRD